MLTKCRRVTEEGQFLFDQCTRLVNNESIDISHFPYTEQTPTNIGYYHTTLKRVNATHMGRAIQQKQEHDIVRLPRLEKGLDPKGYSQDVTLCVGMPVVCIRTDEKVMKVCNGEIYTIVKLSNEQEAAKALLDRQQLRALCKAHKLKLDGRSDAQLRQALDEMRLIWMQNKRCVEDLVSVPALAFQKYFRVAYCITYYQSQGCTIDSKYTIHDWNAPHVDWRAKNVALSRATRTSDVQIASKGF